MKLIAVAVLALLGANALKMNQVSVNELIEVAEEPSVDSLVEMAADESLDEYLDEDDDEDEEGHPIEDALMKILKKKGFVTFK